MYFCKEKDNERRSRETQNRPIDNIQQLLHKCKQIENQ